MMPPGIDRLVEAVQTNCHIADARGAADLTLCIYLLQMRELYRWEQGIAALQPLPRDDVAEWLAAREALWAELEARDFAPLPLAGQGFDPFDVAGINAQLRPHGPGVRRRPCGGRAAPASFSAGSSARDARDERRTAGQRHRACARPGRAGGGAAGHRPCCCASSRCGAGWRRSTRPGR